MADRLVKKTITGAVYIPETGHVVYKIDDGDIGHAYPMEEDYLNELCRFNNWNLPSNSPTQYKRRNKK